MSPYDFKDGKRRVLDILDSRTNIRDFDYIPSDKEFSFENGVRSPVASIFVDIRESTSLFKNNPRDRVARIIRSFVSEVIHILRSDDNIRDLGIRGDCVFAVYSCSTTNDTSNLIDRAVEINTFMKMYNRLLECKRWPEIKIGIGLGFDQTQLVIKAGEKGSGYNDFIWVGNAVINASNCCGIANTSGISPIVMDTYFYEKIKNLQANPNHKYIDYLKRFYSNKIGGYYYQTDLVDSKFNNWINDGMYDKR